MDVSGSNLIETVGIGFTSQPASQAASEEGLVGRNQLSRQDFYSIMIAELTNQDPFEPMDNQQFLEQVASLQSLESTGKLTEGIEKLLFRQELSSASGLIGKTVVAIDEQGESVSGVVERLRIENNTVQLVIENEDGTREIPMSRLVEVASSLPAISDLPISTTSNNKNNE